MAERHDCGPTAMLQVLRHARVRIDRELLLHTWRFPGGCDRYDTPGHHLRALRRLDVPHAMARRLGCADIAHCVAAGSPVVLLVPRGAVGWHWVVVCGGDADEAAVSPGDGTVRRVRLPALVATCRGHAMSRCLNVDGLGYVVGAPLPLVHDVRLAHLQLRLAALAEDWLWAAESPAAVMRAATRKFAWRGRPGGDILCPADEDGHEHVEEQ